MIYEFEVPGKITGKGRPRVNTNTGVAYTPTKTKEYEELVKQYFWIKYPRVNRIEGRTSVKIIAYFGIPKNTSKKDKENMLNNAISPTKKPDIDNITKIILDALNAIAFKDDNQITKLEIEKQYSEEERVYIKIEEY
jgi:Holliday junction resolvase RusA-like endonuclease